MLFRFLCVVWGYSSNHGDQLDIKVGAILQTQALYVGRALLSAQPAATLEQLAAVDSPGKTQNLRHSEHVQQVNISVSSSHRLTTALTNVNFQHPRTPHPQCSCLSSAVSALQFGKSGGQPWELCRACQESTLLPSSQSQRSF